MILLFFILFWLGEALSFLPEVPKGLGFLKKDSMVKVDGKLDKREWRNARSERGFTSPWLKREPPVTEFFAKVDGQYFNFAYRVKDKDIVLTDFRKESDVAKGDRVEIFFAKSRDLKEYYCLEISPKANVLDYKASFYRNFDDTWDLQGLSVAAEIKRGGYVVEGRIPLEELKKLGVVGTSEKGSCFLMGLYRAEYSLTQSDRPQVEWISWVRPDTIEPDFHVPSSFGSFCLAPE